MLHQESVWDYPRPPLLEPVAFKLSVDFNGQRIAETTDAYRVLETSHPPTYYLPLADCEQQVLSRSPRQSFCEFKGTAQYWDVTVGDATAPAAGWSYPAPTAAFTPITDYLSFYASAMDACWVGDEQVQAQEGDFYGGWITSNLKGPFKGAPGTRFW